MMKINQERAIKLASSGQAILIDTRSPVEFNKGTMHGAINLVLRNISTLVAIVKDRKTSLVFFGTDAYMAAQYAFTMGFPKVFYIENLIIPSEEKVKS